MTPAICAAVLFPLLAVSAATHEPPPLWGSLRPGRYATGFRVNYAVDHGRRDLARQGAAAPRGREGLDDASAASVRVASESSEARTGPARPPIVRSSSTEAKPMPRPVLMAIWYPALPSPAPASTYDHYLKPPPSVHNPAFAPALAQHSLHALSQIVTAGDQLDRLRQLEIFARDNAAPATGTFPVVLYHPGAGGSYDENAVLCEFLASHGYVVLSSAYQRSSTQVSNNIGGSERSIRDMQFLLNEASRLPYADVTRTAGVGHSAGAQFLLEWIGDPECPLRALAALDTTLEYTPERFAGHRPLRRKLAEREPPSIPVLLTASADRHPNFKTFDQYLRRASRRNVALPALTHDDYLTHGLLRTFAGIRNRAGADPTSVREAYAALCQAVLSFLQQSLNAPPA